MSLEHTVAILGKEEAPDFQQKQCHTCWQGKVDEVGLGLSLLSFGGRKCFLFNLVVANNTWFIISLLILVV